MGVLRDLVTFVQFKNVKDTHRVTLLHVCFSGFLNCTNGTKSRNASHISPFLHYSTRIFQIRCYLHKCFFFFSSFHDMLRGRLQISVFRRFEDEKKTQQTT